MHRREVLIAAGVSTLAMGRAGGAAPDAGTARRTTAPNVSGRTALIDTGNDCVRTGEICLDHCLRTMAGGDTSLARCAQSVTEMLAMCHALVTMSAQGSARLKEVARVCGQVCRDCEAACKEHAAHHEVCRRCMESCQACAAACEKFSA
jgi:Cys-rich four helix bundle protein (predicted Tat secretion target)